jgi:hypothetical protein
VCAALEDLGILKAGGEVREHSEKCDGTCDESDATGEDRPACFPAFDPTVLVRHCETPGIASDVLNEDGKGLEYAVSLLRRLDLRRIQRRVHYSKIVNVNGHGNIVATIGIDSVDDIGTPWCESLDSLGVFAQPVSEIPDRMGEDDSWHDSSRGRTASTLFGSKDWPSMCTGGFKGVKVASPAVTSVHRPR